MIYNYTAQTYCVFTPLVRLAPSSPWFFRYADRIRRARARGRASRVAPNQAGARARVIEVKMEFKAIIEWEQSKLERSSSSGGRAERAPRQSHNNTEARPGGNGPTDI